MCLFAYIQYEAQFDEYDLGARTAGTMACSFAIGVHLIAGTIWVHNSASTPMTSKTSTVHHSDAPGELNQLNTQAEKLNQIQ